MLAWKMVLETLDSAAAGGCGRPAGSTTHLSRPSQALATVARGERSRPTCPTAPGHPWPSPCPGDRQAQLRPPHNQRELTARAASTITWCRPLGWAVPEGGFLPSTGLTSQLSVAQRCLRPVGNVPCWAGASSLATVAATLLLDSKACTWGGYQLGPCLQPHGHSAGTKALRTPKRGAPCPLHLARGKERGEAPSAGH